MNTQAEIITGSTGKAHVTPIDDAVRNTNCGYYTDNVVFDVFNKFHARKVTENLIMIASGYGMMHGRYFKIAQNDEVECIIESGSQNTKRQDVISARYTLNQNLATEQIQITVIKGEDGTSYTPPANLHTDGDINAGAVIYDFPLYDVFINGTSIESIVPRFTALPDGGRLGEIEAAFQNVLNEFENVQNTVNNLPADISQAASKQYVDSAVGQMGNGKASLLHNYNLAQSSSSSSTIAQMGGTSTKYGHVKLSDKSDFSNSTPKTAADAVGVTEKALNDAISALKQSFMDGCNGIATALINKGVTPTKGENTENYTPQDFINAIDALLAKRKRAVTYSIAEQTTQTGSDANYNYFSTTATIKVGSTTKTFSGTGKQIKGYSGDGVIISGSWTQNV